MVSSSTRVVAGMLAVAVGLLDAAPAAASAAPAVTRLADTQLDATGIYFVSYNGLVNGTSYQQHGLLSHAGFQYAAWYTGSRHAVVARRRLPVGEWESARLPHQLSTNDSHNSISVGISPNDGRLHIAMDTHNNPVFYIKSEPGLVSNPAGASWSAARFEDLQHTLDGVDLGSITYPRFAAAPGGQLLFSYRTGVSGNGWSELAEYDGTWRKLGKWSTAGGAYTFHGATSNTRNMYLHGLTYEPGGRLHAAFTWREGNPAVLCHRGGVTNHDTGYAYSDDRGRTWHNNAGARVATTGSGTLVGVRSPGLVVDPLDVDHGLMNDESQAVDSAGNPHVIISYVPGRFTACVTDFAGQRRAHGRTLHLYRDSLGKWRKRELPVPLNAYGRSQIVLDAADNAYVVMPYGRIVTASKASGWTDWTLRFDGAGLDAHGEVVVDRTRTADGFLSVLYQRRSTGTTPSPVRVADFRLGPIDGR